MKTWGQVCLAAFVALVCKMFMETENKQKQPTPPKNPNKNYTCEAELVVWFCPSCLLYISWCLVLKAVTALCGGKYSFLPLLPFVGVNTTFCLWRERILGRSWVLLRDSFFIHQPEILLFAHSSSQSSQTYLHLEVWNNSLKRGIHRQSFNYLFSSQIN